MARYLLFVEKDKAEDKQSSNKGTMILATEKATEETEEELDLFKDIHFGRDLKKFNKTHKKSRSIGVINYEGYDYSPVISEEISMEEEFKGH
jgi:hypothetical protein